MQQTKRLNRSCAWIREKPHPQYIARELAARALTKLKSLITDMNITGNTILITGGNSGIGHALAEALHARGNQVVISGRNEKTLRETVEANPGMKFLRADLSDAQGTRAFADAVKAGFPDLNVLILNAGIMQQENVRENPEAALAIAENTIATNLLTPLRLTAHLLPLLQGQPRASIMTVSSGLAFVPLFLDPTYCATKAAIHSYSQSLRYQLKDTAVEVVELVPPYVATTLQGEAQANDPHAMPLDEFIAETMELIRAQPDATEIVVERIHAQRFAASGEGGAQKYEQFFTGFNDTMAQARAEWDR